MLSNELIAIMAPALVAGLMVAITHAPLGIEVLKRGIIFIDLAIAQIAGLGLIVTHRFFDEPAWWLVQSGALLFAIIGGFFFRWAERKIPSQQEAIIGCCFVLTASLTLLFLTDHPRGGEEIQHLLSGQILFVSWADVISHAPIYGCIIIAWFAWPRVRSGWCFYALFALAITSSVQLVGIYVVFASLVLPALAALGSNRPHRSAWTCGLVSVLVGVVVSAYTDLPAGPIFVVCYVAICILQQSARRLTR